jgi:hypothetical protein
MSMKQDLVSRIKMTRANNETERGIYSARIIDENAARNEIHTPVENFPATDHSDFFHTMSGASFEQGTVSTAS